MRLGTLRIHWTWLWWCRWLVDCRMMAGFTILSLLSGEQCNAQLTLPFHLWLLLTRSLRLHCGAAFDLHHADAIHHLACWHTPRRTGSCVWPESVVEAPASPPK